jgi:hypothetical protein
MTTLTEFEALSLIELLEVHHDLSRTCQFYGWRGGALARRKSFRNHKEAVAACCGLQMLIVNTKNFYAGKPINQDAEMREALGDAYDYDD